MSGRIPRRVLISKIQRNDKEKSGRWGKAGIILCGGGTRSQRAMCNYIMRRTGKVNKEEKYDGPPGPDWTYAPDANFRLAVQNAYPAVEVKEAYFRTSTIDTITLLSLGSSGIEDLTGIEGFIALNTLYCQDNSFNTLDVSANTALTELNCSDSSLNSIIGLNVGFVAGSLYLYRGLCK